jgi:hypothetical protein
VIFVGRWGLGVSCETIEMLMVAKSCITTRMVEIPKKHGINMDKPPTTLC